MKCSVKNAMLFFISIFFFLGCNKQENTFFLTKKDISHEILISEKQLLDPWDILLVDSILIVANEKGEPLLECYDLNGNKVNSFLTKGNGPEEVLMIGSLQVLDNGSQLLVYDLFKKRFLHYDFTSPLNDLRPDTSFNYIKQLEDSIAIFDKLFFTNDYLIGESRSPEGRVVLMRKNGSLIRYAGEYPPKTEIRISDFENAALYGSGFTIRNDGKKVAISTYAAGMIDIFSIKNDSLISDWSFIEYLPSNLHFVEIGETLRAAITDETKYGYPDIESTNRFVYTLYSGRKVKEKNYSFGRIIRIIDWEGERGLELYSSIDLRRITISTNNQYIYAIAKDDNNNPCIVSFYIGDIMKNFYNLTV